MYLGHAGTFCQAHDGFLDTSELTEMVTMYHDMKLAQKEGVIVIDAMPAEMQPALRIFDMLGDRQVAPMELARGAELYQLSKDKAKLMGRIAMVLSAVLIVLIAAIGIMNLPGGSGWMSWRGARGFRMSPPGARGFN